jgi:hypothetical protein
MNLESRKAGTETEGAALPSCFHEFQIHKQNFTNVLRNDDSGLGLERSNAGVN